MNLLDSIDKSAYTLLFSEETEMSPYGDSGGGDSSKRSSRTYTAGAQSSPTNKSQNSTGTITSVTKQHTILNMKTTLVNGGSYENCDTSKCDSESDVESAERKPLVQAEVKHGIPPTIKSNNELNSSSCNALTLNANATISTTSHPNLLPPPSSSFNLISHPGSTNFTNNISNNATDQFIIGSFFGPPSPQPSSSIPMVGSMNELQAQNHLKNVDLVSNNGMPVVTSTVCTTVSKSNWGPDSFSSNLSTGSAAVTVNSYSEGQKVLPSSYFIKDYSNIFGNIANTYETEEICGEVAKLPINNTSQESKMFLIGLSSNIDDNDDEDERDTMENEDQGSSNSPFQSATEEMGGDGDHDLGGDQDPLLVRPPPKQNVFHQFIRSATRSTKGRRMRPTRNGKHCSLGKDGQGFSRDTCSSSSALIKEVEPPEDGQDDDNGDHTTAGSSSSVGHQERTGRRCSIGILLAAISCFFFATSALIVKISNLHPMELLAVRGLIQGILISPIVISTGNSFMGPSGSRSLLLARAVLGAVALVMGFASIHLIQLSDAATVIFTSPVFVSIFACICLGEVCNWFDVFMITLTLVGVLLVSKPSFNFINTGTWTGIVGTICGLIAAMLTALAFIVLRQLKQIHYSVVVFWFSSVLATFGAVLTVALDGFTLPRTWAAVMECIGIGFCGFMGQILLTKALQSENALPIAVTRTFDIVLAFFYQITLLHDTPDWYSYLGSVLVVSCVLLTAFRRWYKESVTKKYQRVHKMADDEPIVVDGSHEHESSSSPPQTRSHHNHLHLHHTKESGDLS